MGKYGASLIHEWWSDWHYANQNIKRTAWLADGDQICFSTKSRIWHEIRETGIVAILDLKWKWNADSEIDKITVTEMVMMDFYENHKIPYYIIVIDPLPRKPEFYVYRPKLCAKGDYATLVAQLDQTEMVNWINEDYAWSVIQAISVNKIIEFEVSPDEQ